MTTVNGPANSRDAVSSSPRRESPASGSAACEHSLRTLSPAECFDLLEPGGIGRVGFTSADGTMMLPVNFAMTGRLLSSAPHRTLCWPCTPRPWSASKPTASTRRAWKAGASWYMGTRTRSQTSAK